MVLQSDAEAAIELWLASPAYRSRPVARTGRIRRAFLPKWARSDAAIQLPLLMPPSTAVPLGGASPMPPLRHASPWTGYWRAVRCPGLLGACRKTLRACVRACAKSLRVRSVPKVCCIQQSSTKKDAVPGRCSEPKIVCGSVGALHTPGARYIRLSHALPRCLRTNISRATARAKLQQITT